MMVLIAQKLESLGHKVEFVFDGEGMGFQVLIETRTNFQVQFESVSGLHRLPTETPDLVFISTCASANKVEKAFARAFSGIKPVVFGADGFFNHGYKWREDNADFWFAINEAHAQAIRALRPLLNPDRVKVVGQPAFDSCLELIPKKDLVRREQRLALGIQEEEKAFLWFSQGMPEVIEEDLEMMTEGIRSLGSKTPHSVFIPRVHPKLDKLKSGYVESIYTDLRHLCQQNGVRLIRADNLRGEELCLASDVIISITATDDIKNWLMGGPLVIHLMGPKVRQWFEESLLLKPPNYLPDVQAEEALAVRSKSDWSSVIAEALNPEKVRFLRRNWRAPETNATEITSTRLIEIANLG
ncbi:MAG: hypothetical protein AAB584_02295 [Patescibacteria group bacterium]